MTNPELVLINEIQQIPLDKGPVFTINLEKLKENCYIPQNIPLYEDDLNKAIGTLVGGSFRTKDQLNAGNMLMFRINDITVQLIIRFRITPFSTEGKRNYYNNNKVDYPANKTEGQILEMVPNAALDGSFFWSYSKKDHETINFLEGTATLLALSSVIYNIAVTESGLASRKLELVFEHYVYGILDQEEFEKIHTLVNFLTELRKNTVWGNNYPRLLVNKNVKDKSVYTTNDLKLYK